MAVPCAKGYKRQTTLYLARFDTPHEIAGAELSVRAGPPAERRAIHCQAASVIAACRDGREGKIAFHAHRDCADHRRVIGG
jgi:hypothetical protein